MAARAQQTAMPVIRYLDIPSPEAVADRLPGFRRGLKENGYVEGENVAAERLGREWTRSSYRGWRVI